MSIPLIDVRPLVMGIVNVTPDSFSDGGRHERPAEAVEHARRLIAEGADLIDVGGESSRPGAEAVDAATELRRILPVITALAGEVRISVDTAKPEVAREAVAAGASLVNDITSNLAEVAAETGAGWLAMHMRGEPRTMQHAPIYQDVVTEVLHHLTDRADAAHRLGIDEIWIDPGIGIGFGKTAAHNWQILRDLDRFVTSGWPVAVGVSRKAFLGRVSADADGEPEPTPTNDRLEASLATVLHTADAGVRLVRVHDVAATVAALDAAGHQPASVNYTIEKT